MGFQGLAPKLYAAELLMSPCTASF